MSETPKCEHCQREHPRRWSCRITDFGVVQVCRGEHDKSLGCEWEILPAASPSERAPSETTAGTLARNLGPIVLMCMHPDARDLLDTAIEQWRELLADRERREIPMPKDEAYSFAYWLFRYSGLVAPASALATLRAAVRAQASELEDLVAANDWPGVRRFVTRFRRSLTDPTGTPTTEQTNG